MKKFLCLVLFFSCTYLTLCPRPVSAQEDILGNILLEKIACLSSYNETNFEYALAINFYEVISEHNYKAGLFTSKGKYAGAKMYQYSLTLYEKKENELVFKIAEMELIVHLKIKERYAEIYQKNRRFPKYICS